MRALAAELGIGVSTTRRLVRRGPPRSWSPERVERLASELFRRAHEAEVVRRRSPTAQAVLERRRRQAAVVYPLAARRAAMASIRRALRDYEARAECAYGSWTPRAELAREMARATSSHVTSVRLGRWLARGQVPASMMGAVSEWARERAERELLRLQRQELAFDLVQRAKRPGFAHALPGAPRVAAARAADLYDGERVFQSEDNVGYQWDRRVEEWSTFELISRLEKWALSRRLPPGRGLGKLDKWIVTALVSIYDPPDSLAQKDERRRGRKRGRSPGAIRQFERRHDPKQMSRDLQVGAVVSSCTVRRGGLERATRLWRENMVIETCENELVFIHGLIIRNWRVRGERERIRYVKGRAARFAAEVAKRERERERRADRERARARKKALGRRGSRASDARPARKKKR